MKFRKKPVVVEAHQWDGTYLGARALEKLLNLDTRSMEYHKERNSVGQWRIGTLEGGHDVFPGDWIIRGIAGEHYPCKPDIFAATYEEASAADELTRLRARIAELEDANRGLYEGTMRQALRIEELEARGKELTGALKNVCDFYDTKDGGPSIGVRVEKARKLMESNAGHTPTTSETRAEIEAKCIDELADFIESGDPIDRSAAQKIRQLAAEKRRG